MIPVDVLSAVSEGGGGSPAALRGDNKTPWFFARYNEDEGLLISLHMNCVRQYVSPVMEWIARGLTHAKDTGRIDVRCWLFLWESLLTLFFS